MTLAILPILNSDKTVTQQGVIFQYRYEHAFLSNFAPCQVTLPAEGDLPAMDFNSVENAYMAWKTLDYTMRLKMQNMTPGNAKDLTRTDEFKQNYQRADLTDDNRIQIMATLIAQKFSSRNPDLMQKLLDTGNNHLIEGNTWKDTFFGFDLNNSFGQNHLGRIQMSWRDVLQNTAV